jgi:hypothetical protein
MCSVYKITSLNDDRFYLLFSINKEIYMSKILHRIIYNYTQSMKKKEKSVLNDAFIIIQKNNIKIEKIEKGFKDKYECHNYIYENIKNNNNCVNSKNKEYEPNGLLKVVVGVNREKKTTQQMNRERYLKRKEEKNKCKIVLPNI